MGKSTDGLVLGAYFVSECLVCELCAHLVCVCSENFCVLSLPQFYTIMRSPPSFIL